MKKITLALCTVATTFFSSYAQKSDSTAHVAEKPRPVFYLGTSTGINNNSGLIGINAELPVAENVSIGAGIGSGSWGAKAYAEVRYYFHPNYNGWAVGLGLSNSSGLSGFKANLATTNGDKEDVTLDLSNSANIFAAAYKFWALGKRKVNRFYIELGYAVPTSPVKYTVTSGQQLTSDGEKTLKILAPGGIIIGAGFSFAFVSHHQR